MTPKTLTQLSKELRGRFASKQDELVRIPAVMGDGQGNLHPPYSERFVYCLIGSTVTAVYNDSVPPALGTKVWVGGTAENKTFYKVISTRAGAISDMSANNGGGAVFGGFAPAKRYEWNAPEGGQDPLHVHVRAMSMLKLGASTTGGMLVNLYRGYVWTGAAYKHIARQDIDLTSYIPATAGKAALVLVTINTSGAVVLTDGADVDIDALALTDLPAIPSNTAFVCGAIRVYNGQTEVQEGRVNTDYVDLRFSYAATNTNQTPKYPYVAKTANYTLTDSDFTVDLTANSATFTLPTAVGSNAIYQLCNSGTGVLTIATTSSQTIDGEASGAITLSQYENLTVQSTGASWRVIM